MKFLSLFAGIGGFDLGLERAGMQCIGQVEIDKKCQLVLAKHWPNVKRIGDIRDVTESSFEPVDLICGGFPCQPFSVAGKRKGKEDDRYLWPEMLRVISIYQPPWVIGENVSGIIGMELDNVLSQVESIGYEVQTLVIPACAVDAKHRRDRVWILAYSDSNRNSRRGKQNTEEDGIQTINRQEICSRMSCRTGNVANPTNARPEDLCGRENATTQDVPDTTSIRSQRQWSSREQKPSIHEVEELSMRDSCNATIWVPEPELGRVANGIPNRVDRIKQLGNAVVPQVVEVIGKAIMKNQNQDARSGQGETGEHLTTGPLQN